MLLVACVVWALLQLAPPSREITIRIPIYPKIDEVTFDPSRVSPEVLKRWLQLSPELSSENGYLVHETIELCDVEDPRYQGCGVPQNGENVQNAELNLAKIRNRINDLSLSNYPSNVSAIVEYLREIQLFALYREQQKLTFIKTRDSSVLELTFYDIDPRKNCGAVLDKIRNARNWTDRSKLARFDWSNCVLSVEQKRMGRIHGRLGRPSWQHMASASV